MPVTYNVTNLCVFSYVSSGYRVMKIRDGIRDIDIPSSLWERTIKFTLIKV